MGALTIGFMGNAEQASITNVVLTDFGGTGTTPQASVTVQNTGSATVTITAATIDGNSVTITAALPASAYNANGGSPQVAIAKGTSVVITINGPTAGFVNTAQYTIKLMTAKGNSVTTAATYTGS